MNRVFAVGIGPGGREFFTEEAMHALREADVIAGYTVYVDLVKDLFPEKEMFTTPMKKEIERCRWAIETARTGKTVAMVCSGDAGVYGMAGLLFELAEQYNSSDSEQVISTDKEQLSGPDAEPLNGTAEVQLSGSDAEQLNGPDGRKGKDVEVIVVSGVTAATSGAAVLGAPMGHDFCVISLSDLLTPWEVIEKRLRCAAEADFAICLYNPKSKKRSDHLARACSIMMERKSPDTVCGWVRNIGREGQEYRIVTLKDLEKEPIDMFTTVFIGSSNTRVVGGKMVTPRGYEKRENSYFGGNV